MAVTGPVKTARLLTAIGLLASDWRCVSELAELVGITQAATRSMLGRLSAIPGLIQWVTEPEHKTRRWYRADLDALTALGDAVDRAVALPTPGPAPRQPGNGSGAHRANGGASEGETICHSGEQHG